MRIGFCGAQRTGKTTLARAVAEQLGLPYVATNTSEILEKYGYNARRQYNISDRLAAQTMVLMGLRDIWEQTPVGVFDRTPLDVLAYMEADVVRDFPPQLEDPYADYVEQCQHLFNLFDRVFLVQPGIPVIDDLKSAPPSPAYIRHLNSLLHHYCTASPKCHILPANLLPLQDRVAYVKTYFPT